MALLQFRRDRGELQVGPGTSLLAAAKRRRAPLGQSCRGFGVCNSCKVFVEGGETALTEQTELERRWRLEPGWRLACQARVRDDAAAEAIVQLWSPAWGGSPGPGDL